MSASAPTSHLDPVRSVLADRWILSAAGAVAILGLLYAFLADPVFNADGYLELGTDFGAYWHSAHVADTMRTPGYPLVLAAMHETGLDATGLKVLQVGLVTAGLLALAGIAELTGGRRTARICAWLFVAYIPLWSYAAIARTEAVATPLLILAVLALLLSERDASHRTLWTLLCGATSGLALIVRPNSLTAVAVIVTVMLYRVFRLHGGLRPSARAAVVFVVPILVIFSPWAVRNLSQDGTLELLGHNPYPLPLGIHLPYETDVGKFASFHRSYTFFSGERPDGFEPGDARDFDAFTVLKDDLRSHTGEFLASRAVAEFQMWPWPATPRVDYAQESVVPYALLMALHVLILVIGLGGLLGLRRDPVGLIGLGFVGSLFLLHLLYVAHPRYTVPVFPLLLVGAAFLASRVWGSRSTGPEALA